MCFEELSPFLSHRVPNLENAIDDGKIVGSWRRIKSIFPSQHTGHRWFQFVLIFHTANRTPESLLNISASYLPPSFSISVHLTLPSSRDIQAYLLRCSQTILFMRISSSSKEAKAPFRVSLLKNSIFSLETYPREHFHKNRKKSWRNPLKKFYNIFIELYKSSLQPILPFGAWNNSK